MRAREKTYEVSRAGSTKMFDLRATCISKVVKLAAEMLQTTILEKTFDSREQCRCIFDLGSRHSFDDRVVVKQAG